MQKAEARMEREKRARFHDGTRRGAGCGCGWSRHESAAVHVQHMRESWDTAGFGLSYAARKSWAFDVLFWGSLDERSSGAGQLRIPGDPLWKTRLHLLSEVEQVTMEPFGETQE